MIFVWDANVDKINAIPMLVLYNDAISKNYGTAFYQNNRLLKALEPL